MLCCFQTGRIQARLENGLLEPIGFPWDRAQRSLSIRWLLELDPTHLWASGVVRGRQDPEAMAQGTYTKVSLVLCETKAQSLQHKTRTGWVLQLAQLRGGLETPPKQTPGP